MSNALPNPDSPYVMATEAARVIGVTRRTVHRMAARGEIEVAEVTAEGYRLFARAEVERARRHRELHPPRLGCTAKQSRSRAKGKTRSQAAKPRSKKTNKTKRRTRKKK